MSDEASTSSTLASNEPELAESETGATVSGALAPGWQFPPRESQFEYGLLSSSLQCWYEPEPSAVNQLYQYEGIMFQS